MNALMLEKKDIEAIMRDIEDLPIEGKSVLLNGIINVRKKLYEYQKLAEGKIIKEMEESGATKSIFIDENGDERTVTLMSGKVECKEKNIDSLYESIGFVPQEIGEYVFKPSWSKAKEARKFGGTKQEFIDKHFVEGSKMIKIS